MGRKLRQKRNAPGPTHAVAAYPQKVLSALCTHTGTLRPPSLTLLAPRSLFACARVDHNAQLTFIQ